MKRHIRSQEQNQQETSAQQQKQPELEFARAEELLRHDALHTPVPPAIGKRLADSLRNLPQGGAPWWRKLFGRET